MALLPKGEQLNSSLLCFKELFDLKKLEVEFLWFFGLLAFQLPGLMALELSGIVAYQLYSLLALQPYSLPASMLPGCKASWLYSLQAFKLIDK